MQCTIFHFTHILHYMDYIDAIRYFVVVSFFLLQVHNVGT